MNDRISGAPVDEAAGWFVRLQTTREQAVKDEFRQWLAADMHHVIAMDVVERMWRAAGPQQAEHPVGTPSPRPGTRMAWRAMAAMAASLALWFGAEWQGVGFGFERTYQAGAAPVEQVLADGSTLRLQPGSQARVRLSLIARHVTLSAGSAHFAVAHEGWRPFWVDAGAVRVVDLGTRFSVGLDQGSTRVQLWQGRVAIQRQSGGDLIADLKPGADASIARDGQFSVHYAGSSQPTHSYVFNGTPLSSALTQIANGTGMAIHFTSPAAAKMPISSIYKGGDPEAFLNDISAVYSVSYTRRGTDLFVSSR